MANIGYRRRWRNASQGYRFGIWQRFGSTAPARLKLELPSLPGPSRATAVSLLLLTLLALPALQPLLSTALTCGFDTTFHLWRAVEAQTLLQQGVLFARWAPHMAHGYGYPLFLFQSPASAYLAASLNLAGFSWGVALNAAYGLGLLGSGYTAWLLGRAVWGERGAWVTAMAYLFAPNHLYTLFYRASLSESVAWLFPPLVLWGLWHWQRQQKRWGLVTAVLSLAALFATHDVTAYTTLPFFLAWVVALTLSARSWDGLRRGGVALLLGLGSGAFFWLPAIFERGYIQFERATSAWPFLYWHNFLPLEQLLALPHNADPTLLNDWPARGLGLLLLLLAGGGAIAGWQKGYRELTAVLTLSLLGYLFLAIAPSRPVWETMPLLANFQFPWRFIAPATLIASLLAGGLFNDFLPSKGQNVSPAATRITVKGFLFYTVLALLSAGHWGWLYPQRCDLPPDTSLAGMVAWEKISDTLGTTASRELLPVTVRQMPREEGQPLPWETRLLPGDLPTGGKILNASFEALSADFQIDTPTPFQARYRVFAFPGWQVRVNGERVETTPSQPEGLLTFAVPNGRSTIHIQFAETSLRLLADVISLLSLVVLGLFLRQKTPEAQPPSLFSAPFVMKLPLLWLLAFSLLAGKWLTDQGLTPLRYARLSTSGELTAIPHPTPWTFGNPTNPRQLRLFGYDELPTSLPADTPLVARLYWQALAPLPADYAVGLTLVDENGLRWSETGLRDYRWGRNPPPTSAWPTHQYAVSAFFVDMLPGTPPGRYTLQLSLFERHSLRPLTLYNAQGQPLGPTMALAEIEVVAPERPFDPSLVSPQFPLSKTMADFTLWGSNVDRVAAAPGERVLVTLFWSGEMAGTLQLLDSQQAVSLAHPISLPDFGPGWWRSQMLVRLPVSLADGRYTWQLQLDDGTAVSWSTLSIDAPERLFTPPPVQITADTRLGEIALLQGANLSQPANNGILNPQEPFTVTLVWQVAQETDQDYHVFVHLLAADGSLVAQSDGVPAAWQRPTTGWLTAEYILDSHTLTLPAAAAPGPYTLVAGLYQPDGPRLTTPAGADRVQLLTLQLP